MATREPTFLADAVHFFFNLEVPKKDPNATNGVDKDANDCAIALLKIFFLGELISKKNDSFFSIDDVIILFMVTDYTKTINLLLIY